MKNTLLHDSSYRRVLIALPGGGNPMYYSYCIEILKLLKNSGTAVLLVETIQPNLKNLSSWVLDWCFRRYSRFRFQTVTLKRGWCRKLSSNQKCSNYFEAEYLVMSDLRLESFKHPSLGDSLYSEFATSVSLSSNPNFPVINMRNRIHRMIKNYLYSHDKTSLAVKLFRPDAVIVLNGRFLSQAASKDVAVGNQIPVFFLEHGGQPGEKYHLELFQTQDRLEFQKNYLGDDSRSPIPEEMIDTLLDQYKENSLVNPFLNNRFNHTSRFNGQVPLVSIFTSSIDEEVACPNWSFDNVKVLTDRTISLSKYLITRGYQVVVVIHPNAMNKSWADLSLQVHTLKKNGVDFVPPWSDLSSYKLLSDSSLVVTWRSTIGLEAAAYGKELLVLSDSHFDLVLSERHSELTKFGRYFPSTLSNQTAAREYLFHLRNHGRILTQKLDRRDRYFLALMHNVRPLGGLRRALQRRTRPIINLASRHYSPSDYLWLLKILRFRNLKFLEEKLLNSSN